MGNPPEQTCHVLLSTDLAQSSITVPRIRQGLNGYLA